MERLVKDAAKLDKSIDGNSLSYANIVKAINVVQKKMGVYGTTQKEAEKTITGSLNSMKASWSNLLTAMASGENLDQCIDNMVSSVEIFGKNVMPVAERALAGIGTVVEKLTPIIADKLPDLAEDLIPPLIKAAVSLTKGLIKALPSIIKTLFSTIVDICGDQFPILKKIGTVFSENATKIAKFIPVLLGLIAAFKLLKGIGSISSLFGGKAGGGSSKDGLLGGMTKSLTSLAEMKPTVILKGMANLALILGGFTLLAAAFMAVAPQLAKIGDLKSLIKMVVVIGVLGAVAAGLAKLSGIVGNIPVGTVAKGLANMAIMLTGMSALFLLVGAVSLVNLDYKKILGLTLILGVLGTVATALAVFGGIVGLIPVPVVALGLANMAIIIAGMSALFLLIGALSLVEFDLKRVLHITLIIGALGTLGAALSVFAGIAGLIPIPIVLAGLANIALVLGGITGIIVAFGALSKVKGINEFVTTGGELLANLFNVIGKIAGSLIGGFGEGITNSLPKIGANLSAFAMSLKPLFSMFNGVDMTGVGEFFNAIGSFMLKMAGGKILEFFAGAPDFSGVAKGLGTLAESEGVKKFFAMVNGIEEGAFTKGKQFFECLDGISNLPNVGGFAQLFSGENDFAGVASGLGKLACKGVKNFFAMVSGFEAAAFDNAKLFFESLDGISALPNVGGLGQLFSGENDFEGVAKGLTTLSGKGVKNFFAMVAGLDESVFPKVTALFESLSNIGEVGKEGFFEKLGNMFGGGKDKTSGLTTVANGLGDFADKAEKFFTQVNALNLGNLNGLWDSLKKADSVTTNVSKIVDKNIDDIVDKVSKLPNKMAEALSGGGKTLGDSLVKVWKDAVKASVRPVNKVLDAANWVLKQFGSNKKVISWEPYAKGTDGHMGGNALVNDGRGAELVQMPNGESFIPNGRNVLLPNAPKGMKVLDAEHTAKLFGKNTPTFNYADGVGKIDIWSFFDNAKGLANKISEKADYSELSGFRLNLSKAINNTFKGGMISWIKKLFEEGGQSLASYVSSKGVKQWLPTVVRALKMEGQYSASNVARTLFQMKTESGGNPKAINLWDSNAKKGIPSKGLMQVIDPTFNAYARDGFDKNIYDPLSNILASIRYAVSRYGSLAKAYRGVGYANGGVATKPSIFGEDGAEMAIPLSKNKRKRGLSLWAQTGEMLGLSSYTPENGGNEYVSNHVEYNTYSPQLSFTIQGGTGNDRELTRKIKNVVQEALTDMIEGVERNNPTKIEV